MVLWAYGHVKIYLIFEVYFIEGCKASGMISARITQGGVVDQATERDDHEFLCMYTVFII